MTENKDKAPVSRKLSDEDLAKVAGGEIEMYSASCNNCSWSTFGSNYSRVYNAGKKHEEDNPGHHTIAGLV